MAQLAILGHHTRGKEVIEILKMLGGKNIHNSWGVFKNRIYTIDEKTDEIIDVSEGYYSNYNVFTLEEFLEKFPYKVGDKVLAYHEGIFAQFTIQDVRWNSELNKVEYKICSSWLDPILIRPYKEETMEEREEKAVNHVFDVEVISFDIAQKDKYELDLQGKFEVVLREGKYYVERIKPKYPNTYEECCKILQVTHTEWHGYLGEVLVPFQKLLICRNAYWMIAGGWKFDFDKPGYHLFNEYGSVQKFEGTIDCSAILSFPTKEMRDAFYENFKELIEECKEFL